MAIAPLQPNACIGILGGGQLGMMLALAAIKLGYRVLVWVQSKDEPAIRVATDCIIASFYDEEARDAFISRVNAVTLESENIPVELVRYIAKYRRMCPDASVLKVASDRIKEKQLIERLGIPVGPYRVIQSLADANAVGNDEFRFPAFLKRARGGFDGRGQRLVESASGIRNAYRGFAQTPCVLETCLDLLCEISVIVARMETGEVVTYPVIENEHENGILITSRCPGPNVSEDIERRAEDYAVRIAHELKLAGIVVIEMFVLTDGRVFVNEMAPRPHNSGHGTIEACTTSQFEQLVRITTGMPFGPIEARGWIMHNLIGVTREAAHAARDPLSYFHWYEKEPRPGRKVGHVTVLTP